MSTVVQEWATARWTEENRPGATRDSLGRMVRTETIGAICDMTGGGEPPRVLAGFITDGRCPQCFGLVGRWRPPNDSMDTWYPCFACEQIYIWPMAWNPPLGIHRMAFPKWLTPSWWAWHATYEHYRNDYGFIDCRGRFAKRPDGRSFRRYRSWEQSLALSTELRRHYHG